MEKLESLKLYRMCASFATQFHRRVVKGERGENVVYDALMNEGYEILAFPIRDEGAISIERKKEKAEESRFPDALAMYRGNTNPVFEPRFFLDPKYKSKQKYLGVVNVSDYIGYVNFLRNFTVQMRLNDIVFDAPFKIFFYLNDIKEIWVHNLRNPHEDPSLKNTITILNTKEVYQIPRSELKFWKCVVYTE